MNKFISGAILAVSLGVAAASASAGTITYTSATNTWEYTGFLKSNTGDYNSTGNGKPRCGKAAGTAPLSP